MHLVDITGVDEGERPLAFALKAAIKDNHREKRVEMALDEIRAPAKGRRVDAAHPGRERVVGFFEEIFDPLDKFFDDRGHSENETLKCIVLCSAGFVNLPKVEYILMANRGRFD